MVARIQGWDDDRFPWEFCGRKTAIYRQIGNAFPPPMAEAIGLSIRRALNHETKSNMLIEDVRPVHDPVYQVLRNATRYMSIEELSQALPGKSAAAHAGAAHQPSEARLRNRGANARRQDGVSPRRVQGLHWSEKPTHDMRLSNCNFRQSASRPSALTL